MLRMMTMPKVKGELAVAWNVGGKEDQEGDEDLNLRLTRSAMAAALAAREPTAEKWADVPENAARVIAELRSTIVEKDEQLRKKEKESKAALAQKDEEIGRQAREITELRRRLPRVLDEGEGEE